MLANNSTHRVSTCTMSLHKHQVTLQDQHVLTQPMTSELYPKLSTCSCDRLIGVKVGQISSLTESSRLYIRVWERHSMKKKSASQLTPLQSGANFYNFSLFIEAKCYIHTDSIVYIGCNFTQILNWDHLRPLYRNFETFLQVDFTFHRLELID